MMSFARLRFEVIRLSRKRFRRFVRGESNDGGDGRCGSVPSRVPDARAKAFRDGTSGSVKCRLPVFHIAHY